MVVGQVVLQVPILAHLKTTNSHFLSLIAYLTVVHPFIAPNLNMINKKLDIDNSDQLKAELVGHLTDLTSHQQKNNNLIW